MPDEEITLRLRTQAGEVIEAPTATGTLDRSYTLRATIPMLAASEVSTVITSSAYSAFVINSSRLGTDF